MSLIIDNNSFYGYGRALHCLRMLKRMHDAGFNVKEVADRFTLHASSSYGWSSEGEPLELFFDMVVTIFATSQILSEFDEAAYEEKVEIFNRMDVPEHIKDEFDEDSLNSCAVIHIKHENFNGVNFHFRDVNKIPANSYSKSNSNYFTTDLDGLPVYHFRNKELSELIICIDIDYYAQDADTLLEFTLWIKQQLEER